MTHKQTESAINGKQLVIKFNKAVDKDTVLDADGNLLGSRVTLDGGITATTGKLDATNKELTVTLASSLTKDQYYVVTVNNVKTPEAKDFPKYSTSVKANETVLPTVKSVSSVTKDDKTKAITIEFSEPVAFNSVKVGDKFASNVVTADSGFGAKWTITSTDDLEVGKSYNLTINGLRDVLGNTNTSDVTASVTVTKDSAKPTFTVKAVGEKTFDVTFDKEVSPTVAVDSFNVTKKDVNGNTVTLAQSSLASLRTDKKTFRVTLSAVPFDNADQLSKEISVEVKNINDTLGNTVETKTDKVTLNRDTVKPTVDTVSAKPGDATKLKVQFSEAITAVTGTLGSLSGAQADAIFSLTDANGNVVKDSSDNAITVTGVSTLDTDNKAEVTLSAALPATGTYKLVLKQGSLQDAASAGSNKNDAKVLSFNFAKDATPAAQLTATITDTRDGSNPIQSGTAANRKIKVTFNQNDVINGINNATGTYKDGAADNSANYTLNGAALPKGSVVTFTDGTPDSVVLDFSGVADADLPAVLKEGGNISVSVANVKTASGSTVAYTTRSAVVADTTAPKLKSAYVQGNNAVGYTITATFTEALDDVVNSDLALIGVDTTAGTPLDTFLDGTNNTIVQSATDKSKVTITVKNAADVAALNTALATAGTLTIGVAGNTNGLEDASTAKNDVVNIDFTSATTLAATSVQITEYQTVAIFAADADAAAADATSDNLVVTKANVPTGATKFSVSAAQPGVFAASDVAANYDFTNATTITDPTNTINYSGGLTATQHLLVTFYDASGNVVGYTDVTIGA